jgi:hypothetical protein
LTEQFEIPGEENYVKFARKIQNGEWFIVDDEIYDESQPVHLPIRVEEAAMRSN